jgi:hypothetical protein
MRKKMFYLFAFVLSMSLYASSKEYISTGKCNVVCKKQIKEISKDEKLMTEEDMLDLSPITHFLLFQI